jgi:NnrS protein
MPCSCAPSTMRASRLPIRSNSSHASSGAAVPTAFSPLDWHIHEMPYGHVAAVMTGVLLTAIPNWTGRLPVRGGPLAALAALWIVGRVAVCLSQPIGALAAAVVAARHPVEVVQGGALNFRWIALIV